MAQVAHLPWDSFSCPELAKIDELRKVAIVYAYQRTNALELVKTPCYPCANPSLAIPEIKFVMMKWPGVLCSAFSHHFEQQHDLTPLPEYRCPELVCRVRREEHK